MKIVQIKDESIIVETEHKGIKNRVAIAKYEDETGVYFYNEDNKKQYASETEKVKTEPKKQPAKKRKSTVPPNKKGRYKFRTTIYDSEGWGPGRTYIKTFKANSIDEAEEKLEKNYGRIFDAELIDAKDAEGKTIHPYS